jgi:hypothetical protein
VERTDEDTAVEQYWAVWRDLRPRDLERMELRQFDDEQGSLRDLILVLRPINKQDQRRVVLSFERIGNLRFDPGANYIYFSLLEIRSIRERQWEGQNYEVAEGEQPRTISFTCAAFHVEVVPA